MDKKVCTKCGIEYYATSEFFNKDKRSKYGLNCHCKECCKKYKREYYSKNKENSIEYRKNHKEEAREISRKWRINNKEKVLSYKKKYKYPEIQKKSQRKYYENNKQYFKNAKHKRRALKMLNGGSYTEQQWKECIKFFNNKCAYTGDILTSENIQIEHIVPISKGGSNNIWNIVPAIGYANSSKRNYDLEEWYRAQKYFLEERLKKIYEWIEFSKKE